MMDSADGVILPKTNVDCFLNIVNKTEIYSKGGKV